MKRRTVLKTLGAFACLGLPGPGRAAQTTFGPRPVSIIVPYAPGGVTDIAGRVMAEILNKHYDHTVVVENRPGASGLIGLQAGAAAKPDGHALVIGGLGSNVIPPAVTRGLPLDIVKAFVPIAQAAEFVNVLVVTRDAPYASVPELVQAIRAAPPGHFTYGSTGVGSSVHLASEFFAQTQQVKLTHVPYRGGSEMMVDLVNGGLQLCFNNLPAVLPLIRSGKVRPVAVTSSYRTAHLPDVPTMQEQGVADFDVASWLGIYGPAAMPAALVQELGTVLAQGLAQPVYREKLEVAGFEPKPADAAGFAERNRQEFIRWRDIAQRAGISLQFGQA